MTMIRQSTTRTIKIGPFIDPADGFTEKTALSFTVKLSKNGGTMAARNSATAITHDANGYYTVEINATDTNTLGDLEVTVAAASGNSPGYRMFQVVPANVYDSLILGTDALDVSTIQWLGTAVTLSATTLKPAVDVFSVSDDSAAANNLELDYDGTGYSKAASTCGLTAAEKNKIADHVLRRNSVTARASADGDAVVYRSLLGTVSFDTNKWFVSGSNLIITTEDNITTFGTRAITSVAGADAVTGLGTV